MKGCRAFHYLTAGMVLLCCTMSLLASAGDVQLKTDHPWYPGELSCSTFERLFATQAEVYRRVTGRSVESDEDKALASWYWRNLHFAHGEEGGVDCFGRGFEHAEWNREYWTGLFAHGFALCGTTHAQYSAEMNALLGHGRGRCVGVPGHNSFEVFLTGGAYGAGKWALLDHDLSTVIFDESGSRLLSIAEVVPQLAKLKDPNFKPQRQRGWRVAGLHDADAGVYTAFNTVEYFPGYVGPPPTVHLRAGETMVRYFEPGLSDRTCVFWGRNYNTAAIAGPERSRSWVNQPENMFGARHDAGHLDGRVRYGNVAFHYRPNFDDATYRQGLVDEGTDHVTFEFTSPYVIGCTPPTDKPWGVYDPGGRNGLYVWCDHGSAIDVSTDAGASWHTSTDAWIQDPVNHTWKLDLTDFVKGRRQYLLRFGHGAQELKRRKPHWTTVCQANAATMPWLHDGTNRVTFLAGGTALASAGPERAHAQRHVVAGAFDSPTVTLELAAPRGAKAVRLYAASWQASGAPPAPDVSYSIDYSTDAGKSWQPVVKDWKIVRRPPEPADFWSQSFCWGDVPLPGVAGPVRVRFRNTGGKTYRTAEAHLAYEVADPSPTRVTFRWRDAAGQSRSADHTYRGPPGSPDASWTFDAGTGVRPVSVAYEQ
jgi:hypothetical protein